MHHENHDPHRASPERIVISPAMRREDRARAGASHGRRKGDASVSAVTPLVFTAASARRKMQSNTQPELALLFVGTADASGRRLQSSRSIEHCPYSQSSETGTTIACDDCVYSRCGCEPLNSSSCCTRSYSCVSDEDDAKGFVLGSILRQVWFIFIVMGIISTIIWRRPLPSHPSRHPLPQLASLLYCARSLISDCTTASGVGRRLRQRRMLLAAQQAPTARVTQPQYPSPVHHP